MLPAKSKKISLHLIQNSRTWLEIDRVAIHHNIDQIKSLIGAMQLGIVVKANAYGHGMELIASLVSEHPSVEWLFTAGISEALILRKQGITKPLLVMSYHDAPLKEALCNNIDLVVYDYDSASAISKIAEEQKITARIHIKVDTGMNRLGIMPCDAVTVIQKIKELPGLLLYGIFSHFSDLNNEDLSHSYKQLSIFDNVIERLAHYSLTFPCTHIISSGALVLPTKNKYTLARVGTNIYGFWKSSLQQKRFLDKKPDFSLQHVLTWKTRIAQIKQIPAHSYIGYNRAFYTKKALTIALLPVGYWDGYPRALSHKSFVLINGQNAPLIGMVSMNILIVDISSLTASINDEVILCGDHDGLRATDLALQMDTINNEFATRINPDIPRIIKK